MQHNSLCMDSVCLVFRAVISLTSILLNKYTIGIMAAHYQIIGSTPSEMLHSRRKVHEN